MIVGQPQSPSASGGNAARTAAASFGGVRARRASRISISRAAVCGRCAPGAVPRQAACQAPSAPPALDLANYAGHLIPKDAPDLSAALTVLDGLVEGYGRRPRWLEWYLAASILRRARVPFRNFEPDWPEQTESMIGAAEAALRL